MEIIRLDHHVFRDLTLEADAVVKRVGRPEAPVDSCWIEPWREYRVIQQAERPELKISCRLTDRGARLSGILIRCKPSQCLDVVHGNDRICRNGSMAGCHHIVKTIDSDQRQ